ncbi:hypothetical protein BT96DRAFT_1007997 [Gymnopus androsaceus JB14]|uniref:Uncharacterized protein n=1 Tax=Gymnopus androsaceus JB14 TaxID=1447944 RepID=A0A6A4GGN2_9AGAR|nr:hypothetical protein BT96DRAFT_1007997 [Gymnopus androsaceus JB14]
MALKPLTRLKGLLQKTKLVLPENGTPTSKPDSHPKQEAAQNAIDNSVWYAAEHKKCLALGALEEPASNKAKTSSKPTSILSIFF